MNLNELLIWFDVPHLIAYVNSTRSDDGGYCFYRLNESNAADTFYAAYVLTALRHPVPEPALTIDFLQRRQRSGGSFQSIYTADDVLRGLCLLGSATRFDPAAFLLGRLEETLSLTTKPYYERNEQFLESLGTAVALAAFRHVEPSPALKSAIVEAVRPYAHPEGGFGIDNASVEATYNAVRALTFSPSAIPRSVSAWIRRCEWPTGGIAKTGANTPNFLDDIYQGIFIMQAMNVRPQYLHATARFIGQLQNANGGFRRAADSGISSLENSYYALKALVELSDEVGRT